MNHTDIVLSVDHLQVQFQGKGGRFAGVDDMTFQIRRGEVLGVVGESGCGKSVTARAIMGLLPKKTAFLSKGHIHFAGKDLVTASEKDMRALRGNQVSMIFQEPMTSLDPAYRIGDQMVEMIRAHRSMSRREAWEKAASLLEKVGIPAPRQRMMAYPFQMSGGMRQRVMIAMALSAEPELLIADEPTTALDVTIQAQVLELMKDLQREMGMAVMLITHDMGVVAEMADTVMVVYAGQVVEKGPVEEIFRHPSHPYTKGLLASIPRLNADEDRLHAIQGAVPALWDMPEGCRFAARCPHARSRCCSEAPCLRACGADHETRCFMQNSNDTERRSS